MSAKRVIDIFISSIGFLILSPLLIAMAAMVRIKLGSPVIFRQERPGLGGRLFRIYKFRTMENTCDPEGRLLPDKDRTKDPFGSFLRSTSLDELPELINVMKGEMSLVGPRPLLMQYLNRYTPEQARRHEVKPGITGWAQVNGRNALSWDEKFELDVWYVDNRSVWLDIKILILTFKKVIRREGINANGEATMPKFYPTNSKIGKHDR